MSVNNYKGEIKVNQVKDLEKLESVRNNFKGRLAEIDKHLAKFLQEFRYIDALLHLYLIYAEQGLETVRTEETSEEFREFLYLLMHGSDMKLSKLETAVTWLHTSNIKDPFEDMHETNLFLKDKLEEHSDGFEMVKLFSQRGVMYSNGQAEETIREILKETLREVLVEMNTGPDPDLVGPR
jgi:hypothetical protein